MKRFLSLILAFCMMSAILPGANAEDFEGYTVYDSSEYKLGMYSETVDLNANKNDYCWNVKVDDKVSAVFCWDISAAAGKTVGKAELEFTAGEWSQNMLSLYRVRNNPDSWTLTDGWLWTSDDAPQTDLTPFVTKNPFASTTASETVVIDVTEHVKGLAAENADVFQFAAAGDMYGVRVNGIDENRRARLKIYYADAPQIEITSKTKFETGSSVNFSAAVKGGETAVTSVTATLNGEPVTLQNDGEIWSYDAGVLADGVYEFVVTAVNAAGITARKTAAVSVGEQNTEKELNPVLFGANSNDNDVKYNVAVSGNANMWYFAFDASEIGDYALKSAKFVFTGESYNSVEETLKFYEILTPYDEWGNSAAEGADARFPANPAPAISETPAAAGLVKEQGTYEIDITDFAEEKFASGAGILQFGVTAENRITMGSLSGNMPKLVLTVSSLMRPAIMAEKDYSFVTPGDNVFAFTVGGNGEEISNVSVLFDGENAPASAENGVYSIEKEVSEGKHNITVTAVNAKGVKRVLSVDVLAKDYAFAERVISVENGTAKGTTVVTSYTGKLDRALAIIAVYDANNKLLAKKCADYDSLGTGETTIEVQTDIPEGAKTVKMFVWHDAGGLKPLCAAAAAEL